MNEQNMLTQNGIHAEDSSEATLNESLDAVVTTYTEAVEQVLKSLTLQGGEQFAKRPDVQLIKKALHHENSGEWQEAEESYHRLITLEKAVGNAGEVYFAQEKLSDLYTLLDKKQRALEVIQEATEMARRNDTPHVLPRALQRQIRCLLNIEDISRTLSMVSELIAILPGEQITNARSSNPDLGAALALRAKCYLSLKQITDAQQDLDTAWTLLTPKSKNVAMAGVQGRLAHWWAVTAELRSLQTDFVGAVTAWHNAIQHARYISQAPQMEGPYKEAKLAHLLRSAGEALLIVKDTEGAELAFAESNMILKAIHLS